jgi:hypothetical protein
LINHSWYFSIGLEPFLGNNLDQLKNLNLEDVKTYNNSPGRTSTKTYTAYLDSGAYKQDLWGARLHADYYHFFFKNDGLALHLYPQMAISSQQSAEYDAGVGLLIGFRDKKDATGKAIVNVEFYCNFLDVTGNLHRTGSFTDRNDIGLRFAFPINFVKP